jgi:hypothetical protein
MPEPKLNPQIKELEIGIRNLRNILIYPLSVRDQLKMKEVIKATLDTIFGSSGMEDTEFVGFIVETITSNLDKLIPLVTDPLIENGVEVDILSEMTNKQFSEAISIIYEENFSFLLEKVTSQLEKLKEKILNLSPTNLPSLKSASVTGIDLSTSSEKDIETEE